MQARFAGLLLLLGSSGLLAQGAQEPMPSMEFLEFLAEWETDDSEWMDAQIQAVSNESGTQQQEVRGHE